MLAVTQWSFTRQDNYTPIRPSPLSPRSANARPPRQFSFGNHGMSMSQHSGSSASENDLPFSKRMVKSNPLLAEKRRGPDEQRERRRDIFMKKVEKGREDKRWAGRSEQILRTDYLAQRRRWEEERVREANQFHFEEFFDEEELPRADNVAAQQWPATPRLAAQPDDEQQVDVVEQMEEQELRALIRLAEQQDMFDVPSSPTRYGSDEEDFDDIFMEFVSSQEAKQQEAQIHGHKNWDGELMDMT